MRNHEEMSIKTITITINLFSDVNIYTYIGMLVKKKVGRAILKVFIWKSRMLSGLGY